MYSPRTTPTTTPHEIRKALQDLVLYAGVLLPTGKDRIKRANLVSAMRRANEVLKAETVIDVPKDAEELIRAYVRAGGKHRDLVACLTSSSKCLEYADLEREAS